ncbi:DUF2528 family protein [Vibrio sp. ABG19]|uniref:DUF2528 family protein n=1 Tax=Vibrio sp. ABG19 TaxID=2817385 RepID=UPI00249E329A|nr:DUF2528 family protein [Vibrio sp. ABG19]WGY45257.1 DUF2528 family protein [Vibrio sp. ABG19]
MTKKVKISSGTSQKDMEMTITVVDEAKFNKECEEINKFFMDYEYRASQHGSHIKAGLAMFAAECFQQMAFNNFKDEKWLTEQFDWSKGKGVEGYPSIDDLGITIDDVESWFVDSDEIEISGL